MFCNMVQKTLLPQTHGRYHLNNLNTSSDNQQILNLYNQEKDIEQWIADKDTAFQTGWNLNIIFQLKHLCIQQAKQLHPRYSNHQTDLFYFHTNIKKERLLYCPTYVIDYQYGSQSNFTCLVGRITGQVTLDRQYSMTQVTLSTFSAFYPMALPALISLDSLVDPFIGISFASLHSFKTFPSMIFILSTLIGLYAKNYPKKVS